MSQDRTVSVVTCMSPALSVMQAHAEVLSRKLRASDAHLAALHDAITAASEGQDALVPGIAADEDASDAVVRVSAAVQELLEIHGLQNGKVEALKERCKQLGATNEELKCGPFLATFSLHLPFSHACSWSDRNERMDASGFMALGSGIILDLAS